MDDAAANGGTRPPGASGSDSQSGSQPAQRRRWRKWTIRLLLVLFSPVAFFALLEGALRLAGYGYSTDFFLPAGKPGIYTTNRRFAWRYFPPALAREPLACRLTDPKPPGTYRIFILGESAARGFPDASTAFGRILEAMLRDAYPDTRFEVINAAVTAINSHAVVDIARECAQYQPDLFVVYMGNNEVVGPFGPGTVFARFSPDLRAIRTSLWLKTLRSGQLLSDLVAHLGRSREGPRHWMGMAMFADSLIPADAPALEGAYGHFEHNLRSIVHSAQSVRAKTIVCTVAVNLKDCAPFASLHNPGLSDAQRRQWEDLYRQANRLQDAGEHVKAAPQYRLALDLDDRYAELHYRYAQSLLASHTAQPQPQQAIEHLARARDLDALRFRTDTRLNQIIRRVAQSKGIGDSGVYLVDAEQLFAQASAQQALTKDPSATTMAAGTAMTAFPTANSLPPAAPGADLFYEHVHFRFEGAYTLAAGVYQQVAPILPDWVRKQPIPPGLAPQRRQTPPSLQQCAASIGFTDLVCHSQVQSILALMRELPFTNQCDHAQRYAATERELGDLSRRLTPDHLAQASQQLEEAVRRNPEDPWLHQHLGRLLLRRGLLDGAMAELTAAWQLVPERSDPLRYIAEVYARQDNPDDADRFYRQYLSLEPSDFNARMDLVQLLISRSKFNEALQVADDAQPFVEAGVVPFVRAQVRRAQGNLAEAEAEARRSVEAAPRRAGAYLELGMALQRRDAQAAAAQFRKALEIDPGSAEAHQRLAEMAVRDQRWSVAAEHLQHAVAIDSDAPGLHHMLGQVMLKQGDAARAAQHLREELRVSPGWPLAKRSLAWLLAAHPDARIRSGAEAVVLAEQLVSMMPRDPHALDLLAAAYAETGRFAEATAVAEKALSAARAARAPDLFREIARRRDLYRNNQPYRDRNPNVALP